MKTRWVVPVVASSMLAVGIAGMLLMQGLTQEETPPAPSALQGVHQDVRATVYMSPTCGCCEGYVEALEGHGFAVESIKTTDMQQVKLDAGVPPEAQSCHTTLVGGYVVEGHVPLEVLDALLTDKPEIDGVALPGMPTGTPGMPGPKQTLEILALDSGTTSLYLVVQGE